jgi:DNA-binding response OmpR family regulator
MAEKTVLVIDDDDANRKVLEILLRRENIRAILAQDGKTGLELARSEQPDLIILDVFMPEEDGFEILEQLKQEILTTKIPVIIFTILEREQSRKKAMNMGACDYITKPFDMKDIVVRIRELINEKQIVCLPDD